MTIRTLLRYLVGDHQAILDLAATRWTLVVGFLFVLSAGFAHEYDGQDLRREPWLGAARPSPMRQRGKKHHPRWRVGLQLGPRVQARCASEGKSTTLAGVSGFNSGRESKPDAPARENAPPSLARRASTPVCAARQTRTFRIFTPARALSRGPRSSPRVSSASGFGPAMLA